MKELGVGGLGDMVDYMGSVSSPRKEGARNSINTIACSLECDVARPGLGAMICRKTSICGLGAFYTIS